MGSSCSKICGEKKEKNQYVKRDDGEANVKRNDERKAPVVPNPEGDGSDKRPENKQPTQCSNNDSVRHYAINAGIKTELEKGDDENMKQNNYIPPNIEKYEGKDKEEKKKEENGKRKERREDGREKKKKRKSRVKKKKHKYWSDSSWSSSSSSSSSSSDDDTGKTTKSKQKKTDKDGNVTYITNKTTIGSSKISFKAAKNVNIYKNNIIHQNPAGSERKLFCEGYSAQAAKDEERNLFSVFRDNKPACGQFIDLRGRENVTTAFEAGVLYDCSHWVGQIVFPNGDCTCFRVGKKYIMTALHAIVKALRSNVENIPIQETASRGTEVNLSRLSHHDIFVDFTYLTEHPQRHPRKIFYFKHITGEDEIPFLDKETDTIVLELLEEDNKPLPLQFTNFVIPVLDIPFSLINHSNGRPKGFDKVSKMVDKNNRQTVDDINFLNTESRRFLRNKNVSPEMHPCEIRPYDVLANQNRHLFHCTSSKGASGSPGVQVTTSGKVFVVTMLLHGYPDWYYNEDLKHIQADWYKPHTIEQGVDFASVYTKMRNRNPDLCNDIFPVASQPTDSTIHSVRAVPPTGS